jgi:hypothetical protein
MTYRTSAMKPSDGESVFKRPRIDRTLSAPVDLSNELGRRDGCLFTGEKAIVVLIRGPEDRLNQHGALSVRSNVHSVD